MCHSRTCHLSEDGDRLRACSGHIAQCPSTTKRTGETYSLNGWVFHQVLTDPSAIDHVEDACRHAGSLSRTLNFGGGLPASALNADKQLPRQ
ncbi:hypothetical protein ALP19_200287 [Pseudomonas syringae pv. tomato]|nr:hypothetical protein ALP19_200287 [Pseudomonas syringae pv. tomato]